MSYPIPTAYPVDGTIPNVNNDPALDAPIMQANFANLISYVSVDHIAPGATNNGFHKQVTYSNITAPGTVTDPLSVAYTNNAQTMAQAQGSASTVAQNFYRNANGIFPMSSIRAFANISSSVVNTPPVLNNSFNVTVGAHTIQNVYNFNIATNAVISTFPIIFVSASSNAGPQVVSYSYTPSVLTITVSAGPFLGPFFYQFVILEI